GEALRIFTGAPVPGTPVPDGTGNNGAPSPDTILMQEDCQEKDGMVIIPPGIQQGANHRKRGEDIAAGSTILRQGDRLRPQDVAIATSVGLSELEVFAPLRVALFSSGDEIRDPGTPLAAGAIYDSNRYCLRALLEGLGCIVTDLGILPDDPKIILNALKKATKGHDLLMTSGGVSVGEEDHMRSTVEALGSLHFWRLAIKPGRPLALGQIGKVPFIGLPGNPVAVMVTFLRFARPAILKLSGASWRDPRLFKVTAAFSHKKKSGRREWVRVRLETTADGSLRAHKFPREGAGILSSMVAADGLVELPEDLTHLSQDMAVDFLPFSEVLT
ncbi:MAG: molybdopterin molybdotransferase MoeA, partial [Rhodospirillaceae bacterium]|nr:molybdopterin molybdotransferase MoeA [Rhodospirillaceae bacterium]